VTDTDAMTGTGDWVDRASAMEILESPSASIENGRIIIVAAPDSAVAGDISLQIGIGSAEHPVCLVATEVAPEKLESYIADRAPTRPALGFVDATPHRATPAMKESIQAIEDIPSAHDLLQLTTAVGDVRAGISPDDQQANIIIPVFDSLLGGSPTDRVVRVLSHVADSTDSEGQVVIGLNYTGGSNETLQTLKNHSDVIVWAESDGDGTVRLDVESLRR
jgi:hypothetical protein